MDLEAIKKREQAATAGPWLSKKWRVCAGVDTHNISVVVDTAHNQATRTQQNLDNAEFIAHAREDIPALIAEVERLRRLLHTELMEHIGTEKSLVAEVERLRDDKVRLQEMLFRVEEGSREL